MEIERSILRWRFWEELAKRELLGDKVGCVSEFTNDQAYRREVEREILGNETLKANYLELLKKADKAVLGNIRNLVQMYSQEMLDRMHKKSSPESWWNFMDEIVNGNMVVDIDKEIVKYKGHTYKLYQKENFMVGGEKK